ncbi:MAG: hypothetical protein ACK5HY_15825, partial [Parahaliea sp.]
MSACWPAVKGDVRHLRWLGQSLAIGLLLALTLWIYWPGQYGPALLDDKSSLNVLGLLADPALASDVVFGDTSGPTGRPVSMASFVLERLIHDGGISGSKRVNIFLHALNGLLVYGFLRLLLARLELVGGALIAAAFAGLWLLAPIQVSTVLYAVQRMAMLAATWVLCSGIAYLYWRRALDAGRLAPGRLLLVALFVLLAVFTKEIALVVVPLLVLMEALWLQYEGRDGKVMPWLRRINLWLVWGGAAVAVLLLVLGWDWLAGRYGPRDFSLEERVLTQGRVLWDYLGQIVWPELDRLGLYHDDVEVSRSLFEPRATLLAWLAWSGVLVALVIALRWPWGRRLVFGPLFYLVGHSLESSVWPLEIYFEHRNYLPGVGLAIAGASMLGMLVQR